MRDSVTVRVLALAGLVAVCALASTPAAAQMHSKKSIFAKENLLAWCIVPYDAAHRGPRERAEMLQRLGIHTLAYDWREEHVPSFEDEIVELIVYNFHHGHEHIRDFAESLAAMQPYLLCVNLNGMNASGTPKILPIGSGDSERKMIKILKQSGYSGPLGILGHRGEIDAEEGLRQNLEGMKKVLEAMGEEEASKTYP